MTLRTVNDKHTFVRRLAFGPVSCFGLVEVENWFHNTLLKLKREVFVMPTEFIDDLRISLLGDYKCFICAPLVTITKSPNSVDGVLFYKYECKNCGTFFFTEIDGSCKEAFAIYLFENNMRRRTNHGPMLKMNPSFYNIIFIVTEEQKKTEGFCGKLEAELRSVQDWSVTNNDTVKFVTVNDVKTMFDA